MFTGALGNTYSADSAIVRIWASVIVLTSSWTSILPRNISNRPKHSHLPLRSPRICLPSRSDFFSPCLIISASPSCIAFQSAPLVFILLSRFLFCLLKKVQSCFLFLFYVPFLHFLLSSFCHSHHLFLLSCPFVGYCHPLLPLSCTHCWRFHFLAHFKLPYRIIKRRHLWALPSLLPLSSRLNICLSPCFFPSHPLVRIHSSAASVGNGKTENNKRYHNSHWIQRDKKFIRRQLANDVQRDEIMARTKRG